jgi:hypothetical protein
MTAAAEVRVAVQRQVWSRQNDAADAVIVVVAVVEEEEEEVEKVNSERELHLHIRSHDCLHTWGLSLLSVL